MYRIAHIANPVAGVGSYIGLLIKHSNAQLFEHLVLRNSRISDSNFDHDKAIHISLRRSIHLFNDIRCFVQIVRILKKQRPDLIHCHSAKAGILGRLAGWYLNIPCLYTPHAYSYLSTSSRFKSFLFKGIEKTFRYFSAKTLACSASEYERTIHELRFKKDQVLLWKNAIESFEEPDEIIGDLELPSTFICSIGRPSYQKNTLLLIEAISEAKKSLNTINLILIGVGHYAPDLEKVTQMIDKKELADNITLIPWLNRDEVLSILNRSTCYISSSRYEGLPYSVLEAMALAKPCILSDIDGHRDLIANDVNGYLVQQNAKSLASAVIDLYNDREKQIYLGNNSKAIIAKDYQIERTIKDLEAIYKNEVIN